MLADKIIILMTKYGENIGEDVITIPLPNINDGGVENENGRSQNPSLHYFSKVRHGIQGRIPGVHSFSKTNTCDLLKLRVNCTGNCWTFL